MKSISPTRLVRYAIACLALPDNSERDSLRVIVSASILNDIFLPLEGSVKLYFGKVSVGSVFWEQSIIMS
mgnify:CR=1 FL=1